MTILRLITPARAASVKVMTDWKSDFLTGYTRELNIGLMSGCLPMRKCPLYLRLILVIGFPGPDSQIKTHYN